jgi:sugar phosphate isomerase/epimerase
MEASYVRRPDFIIGAAVATGVARRVWGETHPNQPKLDRPAVMTLSFNRVLKNLAHPDDAARTLDILDASHRIADRFGIHHVEFQHSHFASTQAAYLKEMRDRLKAARSKVNQICLEFGLLNISAPDRVVRLETIDLTKQWIDHAIAVGCPRVILNQGTLAPEARESAIATLNEIAEHGKKRKVFVTMENRGYGPPIQAVRS